MNPQLVLIAAIARNGVIGADNRLLWRLKSDLRHFRALTMGKPVIMGRKTFDSIGKPLPGRQVIVVSRQNALAIEGVRIAGSIDEAMAIGAEIARDIGTNDVFIAGGGEIYAATIDRAQRLEITQVELEPAGDTYFPPISPLAWRLESERRFAGGGDDEAGFCLQTYRRR